MNRVPRRNGSVRRPIEEADVEPILPVEPLYVRIAAAVKLTGISRSTLYELITDSKIETVKVGRSTFIKYASLKKLFEKY
jgi:excisionase family DNA binding protein